MGIRATEADQAVAKWENGGPEMEKPAAGGGAAGFLKRTEQQLKGRRSAAVPCRAPLGGGGGTLQFRNTGEEVRCFDEMSYS